MAVYEGLLQKISGGRVISSEGTGGYYTDNVGIARFHATGVDRHAGWTQRQFVDIGDIRIKNVMLRPLHDELLLEAVGQQVAVSLIGPKPSGGGRHTVLAVRTPRAGVDRPSTGMLLIATVVAVFRFWFVAVVVGAILAVVGQALWTTPLVGLAFGLIWALWPFVLAKRMFGAAFALDGTTAPRPEPEPAHAVAPGGWKPTHVVPTGGMSAWDAPDPARAPATGLSAGVELMVMAHPGEWAQVRGSNGWTGWVDGRLLVAAGR